MVLPRSVRWQRLEAKQQASEQEYKQEDKSKEEACFRKVQPQAHLEAPILLQLVSRAFRKKGHMQGKADEQLQVNLRIFSRDFWRKGLATEITDNGKTSFAADRVLSSTVARLLSQRAVSLHFCPVLVLCFPWWGRARRRRARPTRERLLDVLVQVVRWRHRLRVGLGAPCCRCRRRR